jgi:hypothetical protein
MEINRYLASVTLAQLVAKQLSHAQWTPVSLKQPVFARNRTDIESQ